MSRTGITFPLPGMPVASACVLPWQNRGLSQSADRSAVLSATSCRTRTPSSAAGGALVTLYYSIARTAPLVCCNRLFD
jgi:hypothetical protein